VSLSGSTTTISSIRRPKYCSGGLLFTMMVPSPG